MAEGKARSQDEIGFRFESCLGQVTHESFDTFYTNLIILQAIGVTVACRSPKPCGESSNLSLPAM